MGFVGFAVLNYIHFLKNRLNDDLEVRSRQTCMNITKLSRVGYPYAQI